MRIVALFYSANGKFVTLFVGHISAEASGALQHAGLIRFDCSWPGRYGIIAGYWVHALHEGVCVKPRRAGTVGLVALIVTALVGRSGKHAVSVSGSPGVMVGDNNLQVSYFIQDPPAQQGIGSAAVAADPGRAAAASRQPTAPPEGPVATQERGLRDHARARKDASRFSGDGPRRQSSLIRVGDKVAQEMEALGPDQAALTIEYAGHPGDAEKLTVGLTRMAPEAACAALCRVHARQVLDWLRYMHPLDPERTVRVMELIGPRTLAAMMRDRSSAEVDEMLARVPGALAVAIRAELAR